MTDDAAQILLASASSRRRTLLSLLGVSFVARAADIDESQQPQEDGRTYALRMAREKAQAAITMHGTDDPPWVLAADTVVFLPESPKEVLGKPRDKRQARAYLEKLSGKRHSVITAFALCQATSTALSVEANAVESSVFFRTLSRREISAYLATEEWLDKAGGYGIQEKGAALVERLEGSYSNVVGFPVSEILETFRRAGVPGWWQKT